MTSSAHAPNQAAARDEDLAQQAQPGHGIPSQDPDPRAQVALDPRETERERQSVLVGGGMVTGAATGAAIGVAVGGPAGVLVGATLGAVAGAVAGAVGGAAAAPVSQAGVSDGDAGTTPRKVQLHVEDSGGGGRPVVLIHGWPLSARAWEPQVSVLRAAGYRVVAYDRRGFGQSDKSALDYGYDALADDLQQVIDQCGLQDVTLVGFSMGGGEVARSISRHSESRLHSLVFAAAVPPYLMQSADNPEGPLTADAAQAKKQALEQDRSGYFEQFTRAFFSADGTLLVSDAQRAATEALCHQSAQHAALGCMDAFASTDFRADLKQVTLPTLVIHGAADGVVPFEGSGLRTHRAVTHSQLVTLAGAPHGLNVTHAQAFNQALLAFLQQ